MDGRKSELVVICVEVEMNAMFSKFIAKRENVNTK